MAINKAVNAKKNHAMKRDETRQKKQRVMGIEPTCTAWKAVILPLNYTRNAPT